MDKSTLSQYGWVIIVIIVIAILLGFSGPFAMFVKDAFLNTTIALGDKIDISGSEDKDTPQLEYYIGKTKLEYVKATFNEDFTEVVITKNGEDSDGLMKNWSYYDEIPDCSPMRAKASTLSKVIISDGVTSIGSAAFSKCINLVDITVPESVALIGTSAFLGAKSLKKIELPGDIKELYNATFQNCSSLEEVILPDTIEKFSSSVFHNTAISKIELPAKLTQIGKQCFYLCNNLKSITLPSSVESVGSMAFSSDANLETIYLSANLKTIGDCVFRNSLSLKNIIIDSENENFIMEDGILFNIDKTTLYYRSPLNELSTYAIPATVTRIHGAAFERNQFEEIILNDNLKEIGPFAFEHAILPEINITKNVNLLEDGFFYNTLCNKITVDAENPYFKVVDSALYSIDETVYYTIPRKAGVPISFKSTVTEIKPYAFSRYEGSHSIVIPEGVKKIDVLTFYGIAINDITIPSTVTSIAENAFTDAQITIVYGEKDSCAETYAAKKGYKFEFI